MSVAHDVSISCCAKEPCASKVPCGRTELDDLIHGLGATPPRISPRYFYDEAGSRLFDRITKTPEYYPTRTEIAILGRRGADIAARIPPGAVVVELGSGSGDKVILLLSHLARPAAYRPIDISRSALDATRRAVRAAFPDLEVSGFEGDFTDPRAYESLPAAAPRLVYYSGSTIGNFDPPEAIAFLRALCARLRRGDVLLLAADLVKDPAVLHAAYNDAAGVTAAFNKNALRHINARFGADFRPERFEHRAFYDAKKRRIEMHLVADTDQVATVGGRRFTFTPERPIHTESSYKFTVDDLRGLASASGFVFEDVITDERGWFAEAIFRVG